MSKWFFPKLRTRILFKRFEDIPNTEVIGRSIAQRQTDVIEKIAAIGHPSAVEQILEKLNTSTSVREAFVDALGKLNDPRAIPDLVSILRESQGDCLAALNALRKLGWSPNDDRDRAWALIAEKNWGGFEALGPRGIEPLVTRLLDWKWDARDLVPCIGAIGGEPALKVLEQLLRFREYESSAVQGLCNMGRVGHDVLLKAWTEKEDDWHRLPLMKGLVGEDIPGLAELYRESVLTIQPVSLPELLNVVVKRNDREAVSFLTQRLNDCGGQPRAALFRALEALGWTPANEEEACHAWATEGQWDKCRAAGQSAIRPLLTVLNGLKQLPAPSVAGNTFVETRGRDPEHAVEIMKILGEVGDADVVEGVARWLGDPLVDVRLAAVNCLSRIAEAASIPHLAGVLLTDPDSGVRNSALDVIGARAGSEMVDVLREAAQTEDSAEREKVNRVIETIQGRKPLALAGEQVKKPKRYRDFGTAWGEFTSNIKPSDVATAVVGHQVKRSSLVSTLRRLASQTGTEKLHGGANPESQSGGSKQQGCERVFPFTDWANVVRSSVRERVGGRSATRIDLDEFITDVRLRCASCDREFSSQEKKDLMLLAVTAVKRASGMRSGVSSATCPQCGHSEGCLTNAFRT